MSEDMELDTSTLLWKPLYKLEEAEWIVLGIPYGSRELGNPDQIHAPNKIREFFSNYFWSYDLERGKDLGEPVFNLRIDLSINNAMRKKQNLFQPYSL